MELDATAGACPAPLPPIRQRIARFLAAVTTPVIVIAGGMAAWIVHEHTPYTSGSDFGYWLGVTGGSLMLALLIYPLRKRFRVFAFLGPLRHWFRFHLLAGIGGPLIVLFHSTFRVGSFNAAIALASMLLVVASGIVGRFIYRKIHNGLYGSRSSLEELQKDLAAQMSTLAPLLDQLPSVAREVQRFSDLVACPAQGRWARLLHFISLGARRQLVGWRVRAAIRRHGSTDELHTLAATIDKTLQAVQRTAQYSSYERLFSLWHVIHIPFLCMLVLTAIVHVVAVHAY